MAADYPTSVKSFSTKVDNVDLVMAADINDIQTEVVAIETELKKTSGSTVDHGGLAGLADNDHPQYRLTSTTIDHGALGGLADNDHPQYLIAASGKAADSDLLDGIDSAAFLQKSEAGWTDYTPSVTAQSGTLTTVSGTGLYSQIGKIVNVKVKVVITTKGTGAGNIIITLPVSAKTQFTDAGSGYSYTTASGASTVGLLVAIAPTSSLRASKYDATTAIVDGQTLIISATYEIA